MDIWPYELLTPRAERVVLRGITVTGGQSLGGTVSFARLDGGGLWSIEQEFHFHSAAQIRTARALEAILDGGATPMVARVYPSFAPEGSAIQSIPFSDDSTFSDDTQFGGGPDGATVAVAAALRATTLTVAMITGSLSGGERFSIDHPTKGRRLYTVARVDGDDVTIRPPLREAVNVGTALDFTTPGCVARMINAEEFLGALNTAHHLEGVARWQEAP